MTFKTLSALLETQAKLTEDAVDDMGGGLGPKAHPVLSRAELVRFGDKMDQAINKLEEVRSIFKHVPGMTGPAHKLGHIGEKGGMDMSLFADVNSKLDALEGAIEELHQGWGSQVQQDTGAFDEADAATDTADVEADTDDLPVEPNDVPVKEGWKAALATGVVAGGIGLGIGLGAERSAGLALGVAGGQVASSLIARRKKDAEKPKLSVTVKDKPTK
jgi:hypothetical protein